MKTENITIPLGMMCAVGNSFFVVEEWSRGEIDFDLPEIGIIAGIGAVLLGLASKAGR